MVAILNPLAVMHHPGPACLHLLLGHWLLVCQHLIYLLDVRAQLTHVGNGRGCLLLWDISLSYVGGQLASCLRCYLRLVKADSHLWMHNAFRGMLSLQILH